MRNPFPWKLAVWFVFWVVLVFALDAYIRHHSLYWIFRPSDKFMHGLAGIAAGTFAWMIIEWIGPGISRTRKFLFVVGCALLVGVGWEVLERYFVLLNPRIMKFDPVDTATDILCDILGGIISFTYRKL